MKPISRFFCAFLCALFVASFAHAANTNVQKEITANTITGDLTFGTGRTLTIASGGTFTIASGATLTISGDLTLPNGAAPTTNAFAEIAGDNNAWAASRGTIQFYDGTANVYMVGTLASDTPTNGQVPKWNTGGTITWEDDSTGGGGGIGGSTGGTDNAIIRADGTEGSTLQSTGVLIDDSNAVTGVTALSLDTDGVVLDTANGSIIILGAGDGTDEDLKIDLNVANVATVTSSTGVATINFSSIALQESGVGVLNNDEIDGSSELAAIMDDETGSGALVFGTAPTFTTSITTPVMISAAADPADAGTIRLGNTQTIAWEAATPGTDLTLAVNASDVLAASGAFTATAITEGANAVPNATDHLGFFGATTSAQLAGVISNETGSGVLVFGTAPTFTTSITTPVVISAAGDPADAGVIRLGNTEGLAWELATPGTDATLVLNSSNVLASSVAFTATSLTEGANAVPNATDHLGFFGATTSAQLAGVISDETGSGAVVLGTAPTFTTSIAIGSAGVVMSDDGDGALTILGAGNGNDEDLVINLDDTANQVVLSSSTGVTTIDFGSIGADFDSASVALSTVTGIVDLGGASSFELPNGATVTTDAAGEIAFDTNAWAASRGAVQVFDGTANTFLLGTLATDTPTNGQIPVWNTGGTITWETAAGTGDVTAAVAFGTDNVIVKSDGTQKGVQATGISIDDSNNITGVASLTATSASIGTLSGITSFAIDTGGVVLDTDGDGMLVILGAGDGFDEDLRLNLDDVSNTGTFTSTTSLATLNFSSIALQESGNAVPNASDHLGFFSATTSAQLAGNLSDESGNGLAVFSTAPTFTTSISMGSAGVRLSDDGDGALTFLGLGNGSDEDLTLNFDDTANTVVVSSSTGVDTIDFGSIAIVSTSVLAPDGTIAGTSGINTDIEAELDLKLDITGGTAVNTELTSSRYTVAAHGGVAVGATETFAASDGNYHTAILDENLTATATFNAASGKHQQMTWALVQDATGTNTLTLSPVPDNGQPPISTTANATTYITVITRNGGTNIEAFSSMLRLSEVTAGTAPAGAFDFATNATVTVPTASAGDNDTSAASTAFVNTQTRGSNTGTHASPDTTGGAVSFTAIMHSVWTNTTTTYSLPAAAGYAGRGVVFYVTGTNAVTIDPNASEVIVRDGTAQTGGVTLTLTGAAGNYVALLSDGARWITLGFKGTLAAGS